MTIDSHTRLIVDGEDLTELDDEVLFNRIQNYGVTLGPILSSTRRIYQRKLAVLMGAIIPDNTYSEEIVNDDDDDETETEQINSYQEAKPTKDVRQRISSPITNKVTTTTSTFVTTREEKPKYFASAEKPYLGSAMILDPDRHTPSPRRSLRTVHGTASSTTFNQSFGKSSDSVDGSSKESSSMLRLIVRAVIFILVFVGLLYAYQNMYSESPFSGLEQLAREAVEAAENYKDADKESPKAHIKN